MKYTVKLSFFDQKKGTLHSKKIFFLLFLIVYVCVSVWGYAHMFEGNCRGLKYQIPLGLELQALVSCLK